MTDGVVLGISGWFTPHGELYHEDERTVDEIATVDWATLLDHAASISFFTRPDRSGRHLMPHLPRHDHRGWPVAELVVNDPFETPELAMLICLMRRAMRDRLVLTPDMLNEQQLEAIRMAVVRIQAGDDDAADH